MSLGPTRLHFIFFVFVPSCLACLDRVYLPAHSTLSCVISATFRVDDKVCGHAARSNVRMSCWTRREGVQPPTEHDIPWATQPANGYSVSATEPAGGEINTPTHMEKRTLKRMVGARAYHAVSNILTNCFAQGRFWL